MLHCRTSCGAHDPARASEKGFTLIETMIALAVSAIVFLAVTQLLTLFTTGRKSLEESVTTKIEQKDFAAVFTKVFSQATISAQFMHLPVPVSSCAIDGPCVQILDTVKNTFSPTNLANLGLLNVPITSTMGNPITLVEFYRDDDASAPQEHEIPAIADMINSSDTFFKAKSTVAKTAAMLVDGAYITGAGNAQEVYVTWTLLPVKHPNPWVAGDSGVDNASPPLVVLRSSSEVSGFKVKFPYINQQREGTAIAAPNVRFEPGSTPLSQMSHQLLVAYNPSAPDQYVMQFAKTANGDTIDIYPVSPQDHNMLRYPPNLMAGGLKFNSYASPSGWPAPNKAATPSCSDLSCPITDFPTDAATIVTYDQNGARMSQYYDPPINITNFLLDPIVAAPTYVVYPVNAVSYALVPNTVDPNGKAAPDPAPCPPDPTQSVSASNPLQQLSSRLVEIGVNRAGVQTSFTIMPHVCGKVIIARKIGSHSMSVFAY